MSLWKIAWRSIQHRRVASLLTALSMALGVTLVVAVLSIHGVVEKSFRDQDSFGYGIIVGAKGGELQLTLNTVFYLSKPVENIPYDYYLEFLSAEQRSREIENSIMYQAHEAAWNVTSAEALSASFAGGQGPQSLISMLTLDAIQRIDAAPMRKDEHGKFYNQVDPVIEIQPDGKEVITTRPLAIPVALGDSYKSFRVVGTTPAMFNDIVLDVDTHEKYEIKEGRNFKRHTKENGFFEAVVGAQVASALDIEVGHKLNPTHGVPDDDADAEVHDEAFTVVGILAQSGTPNDRAIFINLEGFYLMGEKHTQSFDEMFEEDVESGEHKTNDGHDHEVEPLPIELREVTSILVKTRMIEGYDMGFQLRTLINEGALESSLDWSVFRPEREQKAAQAVYPVAQVTMLFDVFVKPAQLLLIVVTAMVCVVSGITILVSIYNSMNERRHEIAVMRALGAGRSTVVSVILIESVLLSLGGGVFGWLMGHGLNAIASPLFIEPNTGVAIQFWDIVPIEAVLIPGLVLLAMLAGAIPAMAAYRTDVAKSLGA